MSLGVGKLEALTTPGPLTLHESRSMVNLSGFLILWSLNFQNITFSKPEGRKGITFVGSTPVAEHTIPGLLFELGKNKVT